MRTFPFFPYDAQPWSHSGIAGTGKKVSAGFSLPPLVSLVWFSWIYF